MEDLSYKSDLHLIPSMFKGAYAYIHTFSFVFERANISSLVHDCVCSGRLLECHEWNWNCTILLKPWNMTNDIVQYQ